MHETDWARIAILFLVGIVSGWLAGLVTRGSGFGLRGNIVAGIIGAFAGSYLLGALGLGLFDELTGVTIDSFIGAFATLAVIGRVRR